MRGVICSIFRPIINLIKPVKEILFFLFLFIFFEVFWKLCVHLGPDGLQMIVLGKNFTEFVYPVCLLDAKLVYYIIHDIFGYNDFYINGTLVYFKDSLMLNIIWTCTSIKQWILFLFIMIFYYGPWKKKLIFIPVSLIFLSFINILRLVVSSFLIKDGFPDWFIIVNEILKGVTWDGSESSYRKFYVDWYNFFHDGFFRWIYYDGILFLIWLIWQEKINLPYQRLKKQK